MKYDIITMKYIFKYFDFCPLLLKNTARARVCVCECVSVRGGRAAPIIPPSGEKHIKKKRKTTQRLNLPPSPSSPLPLLLTREIKLKKKIRQKEKGRKRKALKPRDLSKLLRLSAKITSAGYLAAPRIARAPSPRPPWIPLLLFFNYFSIMLPSPG